MQPLEITQTDQYHKNFWDLIEFFPEEKKAFIENNHNWDALLNSESRSLLILIHDIAGLYSSEELKKMLLPQFNTLAPPYKKSFLQTFALHVLSKNSKDENKSAKERDAHFERALEISLKTKRIDQRLSYITGTNPIREKYPANMLQEMERVSPELVMSASDKSVDMTAMKCIFTMLKTNPLWKLTNRQIIDLVRSNPSKWPSESEDQYQQRLLKAQNISPVRGKNNEEKQQLLDDIHHLQQALKVLQKYFVDHNIRLPVHNWRSEYEMLLFCLDLARKVENAADEEKFQKTVRETTNPLPEISTQPAIGSLKEVVSIVDNNPAIEAVSFDLMDTLVYWKSEYDDRHNDFFETATKIINRFGLLVSIEEFKNIRGYHSHSDNKKVDGIWQQKRKLGTQCGKEFTFKQAMKQIVRELSRQKRFHIDEHKLEKLVEQLQIAYGEIETATVSIMPGAEKTLQELKKRGIKIALLSNAPESQEIIEMYLKKTGLYEYFDVIKVSSEYGFQKNPTTTIFYDMIPRELGIPHDRIIHVGDNIPADVTGAQVAGLRGIHYKQNPSVYREIQNTMIPQHQYKEKKQELYSEDLTTVRKKRLEDVLEKEGLSEDPKLREMAMRAYELGRDYYGAATIGFAKELLQDLEKNLHQVNVCIGRDSLVPFIQQKLLLRYHPGSFPLAQAEKIQYLPMSRKLVGGSDPETKAWREMMKKEHPEIKPYDERRLKEHVTSVLKEEKSSICVIDHGISGSTQNRIKELLPQKQIKGKYLYSGISSPVESKEGYFIGLHFKSGSVSHDSVNKSKFGKQFEVFTNMNGVRILEDFFSGIETSAEHFTGETKESNGKKIQLTNKRKLGNTQGEKERKVIKLMALYGIIDSVKLYGGHAINETVEEEKARIQKLADWVQGIEDNGWLTERGKQTPALIKAAEENDTDARLFISLLRVKK